MDGEAIWMEHRRCLGNKELEDDLGLRIPHMCPGCVLIRLISKRLPRLNAADL